MNRNRALLTIGAAIIVGVGFGLSVSLAYGSTTTVEQEQAIEKVMVAEDNLTENLAAPTPPGLSDATWALAMDPLTTVTAADSSTTSATVIGSDILTYPEHNWIGPDGGFQPLSSTQGSAIIQAQTLNINTVFVGSLANRMAHGLTTLVHSEEKGPTSVASPGGAEITKWLSVAVTGTSATVHDVVELWTQIDQFNANGASTTLTTSVSPDIRSQYATLQRDSAGQWQVISTDIEPMTAATNLTGPSG